MPKPWFDADTGVLLLDEYVADMPSFQKIMANAIITDSEMAAQVHRVIAILKQVEARLAPDVQDLVTTALCELAVLYALQHKRLEQRH